MIYLDNAATTKMAPEVSELLKEKMEMVYGNPSSLHSKGQEAKIYLDQARRQVAEFLGVDAATLYFTSGGSEANNFALQGAVAASQVQEKHLITTKIEHPSVYQTCFALEKKGVSVTYLEVDKNGYISIAELEKSILPETMMLSIMAVNNEVGVIQNIEAIAQIAKKNKLLFHTDLVQGAELCPDLDCQMIDLVSISGHKLHGPKGVGALYIKAGTKIDNLIFSGEQEKGKRGGTENLLGAMGMGLACTLAKAQQQENSQHCKQLKKALIEGILQIEGAHLVSDATHGSSHIASFYFDGILSSTLLTKLDIKGICASGGSACSAGSLDPSRVMLAMGYNEAAARGLIRFSFSRDNTEAEIIEVIQSLREIMIN